MEINITHLAELDLMEYSASAMELGQDAGKITWENAVRDHELIPLTTDDQLTEARDYFEGFGAWEREKLDHMSTEEIKALTLQFVAGDLREYLRAKNGLTHSRFIEWEQAQGGRVYQSGDDLFYSLDM